MDNGINSEENSINKNLKKHNLMKILPSTITIIGFCCGLTSIRFALFQQWEFAVLSIFIAALLDAFDGRVARAIGHSSQLGAELDSLSDLVCFGVAPSIVLFLRTMYLFEGLGWALCMFFTVCCALRLARFNAAQLDDTTHDEIEKKYFTGVPAPAGAMIALLPLTLFFKTERLIFLMPGFVSCMLLLAGGLMVSTWRTFSTKMMKIDNNSAVIALIAIALCVICVITDVWLTLSFFTICYMFAIPCSGLKYNKQKDEILNTTVEDKVDDASSKNTDDENVVKNQQKIEYEEKLSVTDASKKK